MVVKFRTPNGGVMHGRPYTKAEEADFYRRAGSIVGIYRGARTAPTSQHRSSHRRHQHRSSRA
jgi:hypothetical protein